MSEIYSQYIILLCIAVLLSLSACNQNLSFDKFEYQSIAWKSLSPEVQNTVTHDVNDAVVNFDNEFKDWTDQDSKTVPAVSVRFNTKNDAILGPIVVYLSPKDKEVLGFAPRF